MQDCGCREAFVTGHDALTLVVERKGSREVKCVKAAQVAGPKLRRLLEGCRGQCQQWDCVKNETRTLHVFGSTSPRCAQQFRTKKIARYGGCAVRMRPNGRLW